MNETLFTQGGPFSPKTGIQRVCVSLNYHSTYTCISLRIFKEANNINYIESLK